MCISWLLLPSLMLESLGVVICLGWIGIRIGKIFLGKKSTHTQQFTQAITINIPLKQQDSSIFLGNETFLLHHISWWVWSKLNMVVQLYGSLETIPSFFVVSSWMRSWFPWEKFLCLGYNSKDDDDSSKLCFLSLQVLSNISCLTCSP